MFEVYERLPFEKYRQLPGYHATALKWALESPLEYQHYEQNGLEDSDTLRAGRAGHTAVLEPQRFLAEYAQFETMRDDGTKRIRRGKEWDEFVAANVGKTILTPDQFATACAIRDAVRDHDEAGPLFKGIGRSELSLRWRHRRADADCKTRLDRANTGEIVELKMTHDITDRGFGRTAANFRYPLQGAMQRDGAEACGLGRLPVLIVAVRVAKNKPLDVAVYEISDDDLAQGQEHYERAIEIVQECRRKQEWPGYAPKGRRLLMLPTWAQPGMDDDTAITFGGEAIA